MNTPPPRFKNILVLTPALCERYNHTRALRAHCENLYEFNYAEPLKRRGIVELRERLARLVAEKKIDLFVLSLYGDDYLMPPEFLAELRKSTKVVLWCWDDETNFNPHSRHYARAVDAAVTTDLFSVAGYQALGIPAVVCYGNVSSAMYPAAAAPRDIEVSFVGDCRKSDRPSYLEFLESNGVKVQTFGFGSKGGFVSYEDVPRIIARSKISLNFSRLEPGSARTTGHKLRVLEVAMTRSLCLSEYYPALPKIFELGGEMDAFTDPASLLEKVRFYLSHEAERENMADRARARALRDYEDGPCMTRVMNELAAAWSRPARPVVPLRSPEFEKRRVTALAVHALSLLARGLPLASLQIAPELFQYGPGRFLAGVSGGLARAVEILLRKLR